MGREEQFQVKCIGCGHAVEPNASCQPFCPFCGEPMIAIRMITAKRRQRRLPA